ncbi:MAG: hypothetical protein HOA15_02600 [Candidatus Marinimicrobia bacterium]|jgi:uncharacterized membrane protein YbaN (DUF454 family)|nr:hypothetical protein [Candidatus Neomarinimicrobiota bacterium]MBT3675097.1 hypothetical protein [Candidatus Neomarinimicrobiota bacterium]MBT3763551.1 hypothetical protein [Candidatus Neomarinimicrobiota bacterium]MBT4067560.1 hypothetical protein [Candidatus Neomarinimicrobiota bacterium]MBT4270375.1 hypothetical protein [Candidatus Neomarinimicrobiota bacterium]
MNPIVKTIKVIVGIILVIIGLIGGLIPIFQGWMFGIPGLMLLGSVFPPVKRWTHNLMEKAKKKMNR